MGTNSNGAAKRQNTITITLRDVIRDGVEGVELEVSGNLPLNKDNHTPAMDALAKCMFGLRMMTPQDCLHPMDEGNGGRKVTMEGGSR